MEREKQQRFNTVDDGWDDPLAVKVGSQAKAMPPEGWPDNFDAVGAKGFLEILHVLDEQEAKEVEQWHRSLTT